MENLLSNPEGKTATTLQKNEKIPLLILFLVLIGLMSSFIGGFWASKLLAKDSLSNGSPMPRISIKPTTQPTNSPEEIQDSTKFIPGKHYFEDTIQAITKGTPRQALIATVTRNEQDNNYSQGTRVSYFNGEKWNRKSEFKNIKNSAISSGNLIRNWDLIIDPSRVLKQTYKGKAQVDNESIEIESEILENEISVRSLPGYTKFISEGNGTVKINGTNQAAYILYTRIYSQNASDIQFYDDPFDLTTDWIAFWDNKGNFYHIDSTFVDKPTSVYQTHELGVMKSSDGSIKKTFDVNVERGSKNPPEDYTINLGFPINSSFNFKRIDGINKAPNGSYVWYMGNIEGDNQGFGLVEYIHR